VARPRRGVVHAGEVPGYSEKMMKNECGRSQGLRRAGRPVYVLVTLLVLITACSREPGSAAAAWPMLEVPQAARVVELPAALDGDRADSISVEREVAYATADGWMVGGSDTVHVAVSGSDLLVLSGLRGQIAVFTDDGALRDYWAAKGPGPGELFGPAGLVVWGDRIYVVDAAATRLSMWNSSGEYVDEVSQVDYQQINGVAGVSEHGIVLRKVLLTQDDAAQSLSLFSFEGQEQARYAILPTDLNPEEETVWPRPLVAVSRDGTVYATTASTYQLNVYAPDGAVRWVLQVEWPRAPVSEAARRTVERTQRAGRALGANVRDGEQLPAVPDLLPALASIEVDGRDRVYVFPLVEGSSDRYPVDVYDSEGQRITAGWLPFQNWDAQSDGAVYRIETDADTGETVVVRYRLQIAPQ